ncbi:MAG: hypothetical protein ACI9BW_003285 [Gammaproteobacteria bacterium]|jgi:hypothetical protein
MDDAKLYFSLGIEARNGFWKFRQSVNTSDQNIVNASVLDIRQDT